MNTEVTIQAAFRPGDIEKAGSRLMEIRFDCLVKMYDFGQKITKHTGKPITPQQFVLENSFTLEFIKYATPNEIGMAIKDAFQKLQQHIQSYENHHN